MIITVQMVHKTNSSLPICNITKSWLLKSQMHVLPGRYIVLVVVYLLLVVIL